MIRKEKYVKHPSAEMQAGSCDGFWKSVEGVRGTGHNEARDNLCCDPCHHVSVISSLVGSQACVWQDFQAGLWNDDSNHLYRPELRAEAQWRDLHAPF